MCPWGHRKPHSSQWTHTQLPRRFQQTFESEGLRPKGQWGRDKYNSGTPRLPKHQIGPTVSTVKRLGIHEVDGGSHGVYSADPHAKWSPSTRALLLDKWIIDSHHQGKWIHLGPRTYPYGLHISEPTKSAAHVVMCLGKVQSRGCLRFIGCVYCQTHSFSMSPPFSYKKSQEIASKSTNMSHTCLHSTGQHKKWMFHKLQLKLFYFWLYFLWFWGGSSRAGGIFWEFLYFPFSEL